jgi:hypothetical protein
MKTENLRNFTVRFMESELRRVESIAKPFYRGRLSTGEAIRRLAEERLDEIEFSSAPESTQQALLRLLGTWRSGQVLTLSDLRWLAQSGNAAYQRCRRDFVSKELLVANVSAFAEAMRLATPAKANGAEPEQRYFLRNLGAANDIVAKTLPEYIEQWSVQVADRPSPSQAEVVSRNLLRCLRDEQFTDDAQVAKTLAPYVPALLLVAIRGYWEGQGAPLVAPTHGSTPYNSRTMSPSAAGNIRLTAQVHHDGIDATLDVQTLRGQLSVRNFVELEDLTEITRLAATGVQASAGSFEWLISRGKPRCYTFGCERVRWPLEAQDFESLAQCLESLYREPWMVALGERLMYVYGRI